MMRSALVILALLATPVLAQTPQDELRARDIGSQLRCVVCQNQSIEESDAELAQDMRRVVREQIETGASNEAIIAYMRDRYGDYVLLKPPVQRNTVVLWFLPAALVLLSGLWFLTRTRRSTPETDIAALTEAEQTRLDALMERDG